ncbi:MAG: DNA metabolism protein, partial [Bacillota bacterium]|nr:DNA metabolism protein [Bacillota bacterium]
MNNYVYDGSFEGFLTAIYDSYYRHETPDNIIHKKECSQICIFEQNYSVFTDIEKFTKVYASIKEKISIQALKNIYYVFISDSYGKEKIIYNYLKLGWKIGRDIDRLITDDNVLKVKII